MKSRTNRKKGKVVLVGAGPGDEKLITLKGIEAIRKADVIFYDRLINKSILKYASKQSKLIYCGKRAGADNNSQLEINRLILAEAEKGKSVVRLKGGDPFLFGRGAEEVEYLSEKDITVEVIPGVSSAIAVPESIGVPITHRQYASTVVITAGKRADGKPASLKEEAKILKSKKGATLIVLMTVSGLKKITASLIRAGVSRRTPAILIQEGTLPTQRAAGGNIGNIVRIAEKMKVKSPAILVVGETVRLGERLVSTEKPLLGKKILITRPKSKDERLSTLIRERGAKAINVPVIKVCERDVKAIKDKILNEINEAEWIIFTSKTSVNIFEKKLMRKVQKIGLKKIKICAIGEATADTLNKIGIEVDFVPEEYSSRGIAKGLRKRAVNDKKILVFRSSSGNSILRESLKAMGGKIKEYCLYDIVTAIENKDALKKKLSSGIDVVVFTSSMAVRSFFKLAGKNFFKMNGSKPLFAVIGDITEKELEKYNLKADIKPPKFTIPELADSICKYFYRKE
ncbi:MAG: uroporphyrinogen-III C-methyltransferase [Candidatus Schekmanbacteria bacterium]|nr:MAG: uroporphyrinogen-III C-methyltransferase [Candidatus Schekmanbacteria bacterium]